MIINPPYTELYSPKQLDVIRFDEVNKPRLTLLEGAVRSGKTLVLTDLFLDHITSFKQKGLKFTITGTSIASIKRNILDDMERRYDIYTMLNQKNEFKFAGQTIICFGADSIDSYKTMKGFTAFGWLGNEVTDHHINSIDQMVKRCSGKNARIFWDTNTSEPHHYIKENFVDKDGDRLSDDRLNIKSWHFILDDNTFLSDTYKESLKKLTPSGMWYDRDILGLWVAAEGMIYKDFNYAIHVVDKVPEGLRNFFAGQDWGFEHLGAFGLYGCDNDGKTYRIMEIAEAGQQIGWWADQVSKLHSVYGHFPVYCDPARPDNIDAYISAGIAARKAENAVVEGISFCAGRYKTNNNYIVRDTNRNYLKEIYGYRWRDNAKKEEPIKERDDSMDSERYALYSHLGRSRQAQAVQSLYR